MTPSYENDDVDPLYFEDDRRKARVFDSHLLRQPLSVLPTHKPIILGAESTVTEAVRAMQAERRGCVLVTEDGTPASKLSGIFTERDVLLKVVGRGRNPAVLPLREVMTPRPEGLPVECSVAYVLNRMSAGGFRHIPVVDVEERPVRVISVRDVVDFLVAHFPREIQNLPAPGAAPPSTREGA